MSSSADDPTSSPDPDRGQSQQPDDALPPDPFADGDPFDVDAVIAERSAAQNGPDADAVHGTNADTSNPLGSATFSMFGPMMGDLTRLLSQQGGQAWEQARQLAQVRATAAEPDAVLDADRPVNPIGRIRLEELVQLVERVVPERTGLELSSGRLKVQSQTRLQWAESFLLTHKALFERAMQAGPPPVPSNDPEVFLKSLLGMVGPSLFAAQVGTMAGQLAHRTLASCDVPLPGRSRAGERDRVTFLVGSIERMAEAWNLPVESVQVRVAINELLLHAVLRKPHISELLDELMSAHIASFGANTEDLMRKLESIELQSPEGLQEQFQSGLFGPTQTVSPETLVLRQRITAVVSMIDAYVEVVGRALAQQFLGSDQRIDEALRRRRLANVHGSSLLRELTGASVSDEQAGQAEAFVAGVIERSDVAALAPLWEELAGLPTSAELDAPGLWLARVALD
jgi:putative hydrolase